MPRHDHSSSLGVLLLHPPLLLALLERLAEVLPSPSPAFF